MSRILVLTLATLTVATGLTVSAGELPIAKPETVGMSSEKLADVVPAMQQFVDEEKVAGAVTLVARQGKIVLSEAVGSQNIATDTPMRLDTIVRIYSMSKPVTSVATMILVEEGKLALDDPVAKYLPEFKDVQVLNGVADGEVQLEKPNRDVTVRDLLRHTAGLTYGIFGNTEVDQQYRRADVLSSAGTLEDMVAKLGTLPLQHQPGTRFHYSVATDVLGRLVEVASGKDFDEFLQERIFGPLKMHDTGFFVPDEKLDRFAANYGPKPDGGLRVVDAPRLSSYRRDPSFLSGGGGLVSTAGDYMRFCQMLLNQGELDGQRLLQPETVEGMTRNQLPDEAYPIAIGGARPGVGFGLGFSVVVEETAYTANTRVGEYGWGGAASTHFWISPQDNLAVVVLTQRMPFTFQMEQALKPLIYDAVVQPATVPSDNAPNNSEIRRRVPSFVLPDVDGGQVALSDFHDAKLLVLVFMGTQCPIANAYIPDLINLQNRYRDQQVQLIGVNANLSDSVETIAEHAEQFKLNFPVLADRDQLAADLLGATRTPEVFVLDSRRAIRYRGRIDDRVGYDFKRATTRRADLEEAIQELLAGDPVSVTDTETEGCLITRRSSLQEKGEITYAKHVAKILHERCATCHHPGTAAPFSLLGYDDARNWSEMIQEVVVQRRMPPWNADPRYGHFSNDLRMPQDEIDMLLAWIDEGAPMGDPDDLPPPPEYADGWMIGQPDVVFQMPEEYTVPASGTVEYQYFVTPTNFAEDVWVQASEPRPGNRAAVHHIIVFVRDKPTRGLRGLPAVGGFAPGEEPIVWPEGIGFKIPAGAELVWQVHYTPTGKVEKDRSEIGLIFCKQPPERRVKGGGAFNVTFRIPPGAENHRVVSKAEFTKDVELLALMPHMHLRGKDFRYTAHYPDGRSEILLDVPDYDFNWQHRYRFARPFLLPKGTTLECVAHFDNSADNPANPDPSKTVRWGDQTWEEMMIGWYSHVDAAED